MRLINTTTFELQEFGDVRPSYAILSHTWEEDEVLFEDMKDLETARQKTGFYKIEKTCARAAASTLKWAWIDTCCIDKSSSSELSEAINSMFSWYTDAMACYAFITDVDRDDDEWMLKFEKSRWLTRGWTLQELLAPRIIDFFDKSWKYLGSKKGLTVVLSLATRIDADILTQAKPISSEPVGKRMSWAANRQTTRKEDMAYCLLGIFDVNMPMLYGEGHKAFRRLQEEIIRTTSDLSLFAWQSAPDLPYTLSRHNTWSEILARYPSEFRACDKLVRKAGPARTNEFSLTNAGLRMSNMLKVFQSATPRPNSYVLPLNCMTESGKKGREIGVYIALCGHSLYVRVHHGEICLIPRFNAMDFFQSPNSSIHTLPIMSPHLAEPLYMKVDQADHPNIFWTARCRSFVFEITPQVELKGGKIEADPHPLFDALHKAFLTQEQPEFWGRLKLGTLPIYIYCGLTSDLHPWCCVVREWPTANRLPMELQRQRIEDIEYWEIEELMESLDFPSVANVEDNSEEQGKKSWTVTVSMSDSETIDLPYKWPVQKISVGIQGGFQSQKTSMNRTSWNRWKPRLITP